MSERSQEDIHKKIMSCQSRQHRRFRQHQELGMKLHNSLTTEEIEFVFDFFDYKCIYCGDPFEAIEHITPLSKGGDNVMENIGPVCSKCNNRKNNMSFEEWVEFSDMPDEVLAKILWAQENLVNIYAEYKIDREERLR